jgi:hypothetical protein
MSTFEYVVVAELAFICFVLGIIADRLKEKLAPRIHDEPPQ